MSRFILTILSFALILPATARAQEFTDAQKAEIQKMMEEYLLKNGENILRAVNEYQAELEEKDRQELSKKAAIFLEEIDGKTNLPMTGNEKGDITIVEFFDYNCGYCRQALAELSKVVKDDKKVKVVFIDMPILGPASMEAAKWSLAAQKQGKYFEFHRALMNHDGQKTEDAMEKIAKKLGLKIKQLKKDKDSEDVQGIIDYNLAQAANIGIRGTPGFIIAGEVYPGFVEASQIKEFLQAAREEE